MRSFELPKFLSEIFGRHQQPDNRDANYGCTLPRNVPQSVQLGSRFKLDLLALRWLVCCKNAPLQPRGEQGGTRGSGARLPRSSEQHCLPVGQPGPIVKPYAQSLLKVPGG
jgi:hypothetical protein